MCSKELHLLTTGAIIEYMQLLEVITNGRKNNHSY